MGARAVHWADRNAVAQGPGPFLRQTDQGVEHRRPDQRGFLAPCRVFAPSHPDLSRIKTVAGAYHLGQLAARMQDVELIADIVETYQRIGEGRSGFVFCVDRAHAKAVQAQFNGAGIHAGYLDCFSTREEREEVRCAYHAGEIRLICNVGVLTVGIDWDVRIVVLARPTKSEILFVQIVGRGLRAAPGKAGCLILDHSDNHSRLGFVTDIDCPELDDGSGEPRPDATPPKPKECPQ
jgi:DNA repair protein RadD